jgi:hypothetical protein
MLLEVYCSVQIFTSTLLYRIIGIKFDELINANVAVTSLLLNDDQKKACKMNRVSSIELVYWLMKIVWLVIRIDLY